jgi:tetratricopeptide (TPR) repeat protein
LVPTQRALDCPGEVYLKQGKLADAEAALLRSLAARKADCGRDGDAVASGTLAKLGDLYRDQGKWAQAEAMYARASALEEATLQQSIEPAARTTAATVAVVVSATLDRRPPQLGCSVREPGPAG